jgi:hypothetical protein
MFKENGRLCKSDKKEKAKEDSKLFICPSCDKKRKIKDVEFGEAVVCECGKVMYEYY